jgi:hypothetical protein
MDKIMSDETISINVYMKVSSKSSILSSSLVAHLEEQQEPQHPSDCMLSVVATKALIIHH